MTQPSSIHTPTYAAAGVNVAAGEAFVSRIKSISRRAAHQNLLKAAGGYAAVYPINETQCIALTTDGVGTKVLLAHQHNAHQNIGIDLVAMCANDLICVGATPTLFLDYFATGKLDLDVGEALIKGIAAACDETGMILVGGETAEMPDVYQGQDYDLAGFAVGNLNREDLISGEALAPEQTVIGLVSSGIHSNGLSLARKLLNESDTAAFLLEPTRLYVHPVLAALRQYPQSITGLVNITGGGWRNLFRLNDAIGFELNATELPQLPVFEALLKTGLDVEEAYKTFNMGLGFAVIVRKDVDEILNQFNSLGFSAFVIGKTTTSPGQMTIQTADSSVQLNSHH